MAMVIPADGASKNRLFNNVAALTFPFQGQLAFAREEEVRRAVLVPEGMTAN